MKPEPARAWQPLTFGGVARYAHDGIGRLFITGIVISIVCVAAVMATVRNAWQPVIDEAIAKLPTGAEVRAGRLAAPQVTSLGGNKYLSLALDPTGEANPSSTADIHVTFSKTEAHFRSLFGVAVIPYQLHWRIPLNRAEVEPKWGAWLPVVYACVVAATFVFLFTSWAVLAVPYGALVLILSVNRVVSAFGTWKYSVAALFPGALFFAFAILLYGLGQLRIEGLLVAWLLHFAVGWLFLIGGVFRLPKKADNPFRKKSDANPFGGESDSEGQDTPPPAASNEDGEQAPRPGQRKNLDGAA